jgi:hypothetical protein
MKLSEMITNAFLYTGILLNFQNSISTSLSRSEIPLQTSDTLCLPPENYGIVNITEHTARLVWSGLTSETNYSVRLIKANQILKDTIVQGLNRIDFLNLQEETEYHAQIATMCNNHTSIFSEPVIWNTLAAPECNTPNGLNVGSVSDTSARIDWDQPRNSTGYILYYKKWNSNSWDSVCTNRNGLDLNSLKAANNYQCKVMSVCGLKKSIFSQTVNFTTPASIRCDPPTDIKLVSLTDYHATWKWKGLLSNTKFALQYKCSDDSGWTETLVTDTTSFSPIRIPGKPLEIRLQQVCLFKRSDFSPIVRINTLPIKDTMDVHEPNDHCHFATKIFPPVNIKGNLQLNGDEDWFSFYNSSRENKWTLQLSNICEEIELTLLDSSKEVIQNWTINKDCNSERIHYEIDSGIHYLCIKKKNKYEEIIIIENHDQPFSDSGLFSIEINNLEKSSESSPMLNLTKKIKYVGSYPIFINHFDAISTHPNLFLHSSSMRTLYDRIVDTDKISNFKNLSIYPGDKLPLICCNDKTNPQNSAIQTTFKISFENNLNKDRDRHSYYLKIFAE